MKYTVPGEMEGHTRMVKSSWVETFIMTKDGYKLQSLDPDLGGSNALGSLILIQSVLGKEIQTTKTGL